MTVRHLRPAFGRTTLPQSRTAAKSVGAAALQEPVAEASALADVLTTPADPQNGPAIALAREMYLARRRRGKQLPADLFGEPTWDILLDLYVATREGRRGPTTSACIGADVPPTTALRWLRILEARGLVAREDDGRDGRRTFVYLTERGLASMDGFLHCTLAAMRRVLDTTTSTGSAHAPEGLMLHAAE